MTFQKELEELLNKWSMENGSNTPDFILAQFMMDCFLSFERSVNNRQIFLLAFDDNLPARAAELPLERNTPMQAACKHDDIRRLGGVSYCKNCGEQLD